MLTTILTAILPEVYQQAGYLIQNPPAEEQSTNAAAITIIRGFGTDVMDRPIMAVNRSGGSPQSFWWIGNMAQTENGTPVQVSYWHDEATILYEVPMSSGGEVYMDQLIQTLFGALTANYNVLVQPPPHGYGLYFPRWSAGGISVTTQEPGGHLLVKTSVTFSATVPVAASVGPPPDTTKAPETLRFVLDIVPISANAL